MLVTCSIGCTSHRSLILYMVAINIYNITRSNRGTGDPLHWGNPAVTDLNLCQPWTDRKWLTATYCSTTYKYFVYGLPHATCFVGVSPCGHCCFANSKRALGQLIC